MSVDFTVEEPRSLAAALDLLAGGDEDVRAVGGGTGLALLMRYGFFAPRGLVSMRRMPPEMSELRVDDAGDLRMGALATLRDLEESSLVAEHAPVVTRALRTLASVRVRNVATLGGALAHGHPQMDLPPVMIAVDARYRVSSRAGERWLAAEDLLLGYYETALQPGELLTEVVVPAAPGARATYRKVTARTADDWPVLGVAARCIPRDGRWHGVRVAVCAVTDRAQRVPAAEELLEGAQAGDELLAEAAEAGAASFDHHDGPDGSAAYRRALVATHLRRALEELAAGDRHGREG